MNKVVLDPSSNDLYLGVSLYNDPTLGWGLRIFTGCCTALLDEEIDLDRKRRCSVCGKKYAAYGDDFRLLNDNWTTNPQGWLKSWLGIEIEDINIEWDES